MLTSSLQRGGYIMADYYSHNDPRKKGNQQYLDYDTGSGAKWIWAVIVLIAFVALIALGSSGGAPTGEGAAVAIPETAPAAPAAPALPATE